tara:strand:- start:2850 stop:3854 length:1005 start_codon:yes stop_codon:yes gene_type:complete
MAKRSKVDRRKAQAKKKSAQKSGNATTANTRRNDMPEFQLHPEVRKILTVRRGVHQVKLEDLAIPFYIRTHVDPDRASFFRTMRESGEHIDPILVTEETLQVIDGRTRKLGVEQAGAKKINVVFCAEADKETLIAAALLCNAPANASLPSTEGDVLLAMELMMDEGVSKMKIRGYVMQATGFAPTHIRKLMKTIEKRDEAKRIKKARQEVSKEVPMKEAADNHGVTLQKLKDAIAGKKTKVKSANLLDGPKAAITTTATRAGRSFGQNFGTAVKHFKDDEIPEITEVELENFVRHEVMKARDLMALVNQHKDRYESLTGKKLVIRNSKNFRATN